jgi:flagellar hook protein FlgE
VRDVDSAEMFATRRGDFHLDQAGYLVTAEGMRVQGWSEASLTSLGDLRMDATGAPPGASPSATITSFAFDAAGRLQVSLSDGTQFVRGQVLLQNFLEPAKLVRAAYRLYAEFAAARPLLQPGAPGTLALGVIRSGELDVEPEPVRLFAWPAAKQAGVLAEGVLTPTGRPTDVGILGEGFFIVRDPVTSEHFATRAGTFLVNRAGWLVTYRGQRVQGFTDSALSVLGDVRIDGASRPPTSDPDAVMVSFGIAWDGRVTVRLADGTEFIRSQILLRRFRRPGSLQPAGYALLTGVAAAQPGEWLGVGRKYLSGLRQGALELIQLPDELLALRRTIPFFLQGPLTNTGLSSDLALSGEGFFVVRPPGEVAWRVTRAGHFQLSPDGFLLTSGGMRLQGFSDPALMTRGDLRVDGQGRPPSADPAGTLTAFTVDRDGRLLVRLSDGTEFTRGQVLLQKFLEPFVLMAAGDGSYSNTAAAEPLSMTAAPGTLGMASVFSGALEIIPDAETLIPATREGFRMVVCGEPGARWTLQTTTNFQSWATAAVMTNAPEQTEFSAPGPDSAHRYYRVLVGQ